jgi:hypothetical protein
MAIFVPSGDQATSKTPDSCTDPVNLKNSPTIAPDSTPTEAVESDDVCTVTNPDGIPALPIVNPDIVTTNADVIAAPAVVITTEVFVVALHVAVSPGTLLLPAAMVGVTFGAKKPKGYVSVMVPPAGMTFGEVNPSVTGTPVLPVLRLDAVIINKNKNIISRSSIGPL